MRTPFSWAFALAMAAVTPAAAERTFVLTAPSYPMPETESEYVEAHDVLLLDASGSVEDYEIVAMFDGVRDYYLSDEAVLNYESGLCNAVTAVFYGNDPIIKPTYIICSREDAAQFVADNVDLAHISEVRTKVGNSGTFLNEALDAAVLVFQHEYVETTRRRVVVVGDESGGAAKVLGPKAALLNTKFGATISAVSLGSGGDAIRDAFVQSVVTPQGATYLEPQYDGTLLERRIAPGMAFTAMTTAELSKQLQQALTLGGF